MSAQVLRKVLARASSDAKKCSYTIQEENQQHSIDYEIKGLHGEIYHSEKLEDTSQLCCGPNITIVDRGNHWIW